MKKVGEVNEILDMCDVLIVAEVATSQEKDIVIPHDEFPRIISNLP